MLRAIVAGERAPRPLAALRNSRCQQDADEIAPALTGPGREAHLFVRKHALALCDVSIAHLSACDTQSEPTFSVITPRCEPAPAAAFPARPTTPPRQPHAHSKHAPARNTRAPILRSTGVDLVAVPGSSPSIAQTLLSESGTDMRKGPDEKHFCSWLGLTPKNAISGGKGRKSRTLNTRHRAAQAFRMAAPSVLRADCALGALYRRLTGRLGPAQALVAPAHQMARTVYHLLTERVPSHDIGAAEYHKRFRERKLQY